jgi:opacity protein-like surface antigen
MDKTMNNKLNFGIALIFCLTSYSHATVSDGPYLGLELGAANQIINYQANSFNVATNGVQLYNSELTFLGRLNLGYNANKYNGFELGTSYYFNSGSNYPTGSGSMSTNTTSLDLSYIGYLPISQSKFSVFGRIGAAYDWINNSSANDSNGGIFVGMRPSASSFADIVGAGLKYNLGRNASFRLEWIANGLLFPVSINSGSQNIASWTGQTFEAGINYHF